jgi:drug/metabolite transporter (DMT)-like permease
MTVIHAASVLILVSGLVHAIVNAIFKSGKDKMAGRALIDGFSSLLVLPAAFFVPLPTNAWFWLSMSWLIHGLYTFALIKSFEKSDMSVAYPIARGLAPTLSAVGAVAIFHEGMSVHIAVGVALIACGVILIGMSHRFKKTDLLWAILTGSCIAGYTVIDAQGVRAAPTAASYIVWIFLMLGLGVGAVFAIFLGKRFVLSAVGQWKPGLIAGSLSIVTYGSALLAFRLDATPRLAGLRETSILFGVAIAVIFLKEELSPMRWVGIAAIATGAITLLVNN